MMQILGPDVPDAMTVEYTAWQSDQDTYACSGQKCSAQSILFMHTNWSKAGFERKIADLAKRRSLEDLSIGPTLTVTTEAFKKHVSDLLTIKGARLAFGGNELKGHAIPKVYGAMEPTAVFVPLSSFSKGGKEFDLVRLIIMCYSYNTLLFK